MPESTHVMMWAISDRAIPRSFRMMQGFGVALLTSAGVYAKLTSGKADPGMFVVSADDASSVAKRFTAAVAMHRHPARESDPPRV